METLSGTLPSGLRPIARRLANQGDLSLQTRRIVLPASDKPKAQPEATPVPRIAVQQPPSVVPVRTPNFYLFPYEDQSLLSLFPRGIRLCSEWLYIGRNPYNESDAFLALVLNRDEISKVHTALMEFHGKVYVADMGSSNGTKIIRNQVTYDVRGEPVELMTEDILALGSIMFRVARL